MEVCTYIVLCAPSACLNALSKQAVPEVAVANGLWDGWLGFVDENCGGERGRRSGLDELVLKSSVSNLAGHVVRRERRRVGDGPVDVFARCFFQKTRRLHRVVKALTGIIAFPCTTSSTAYIHVYVYIYVHVYLLYMSTNHLVRCFVLR